MKLLERLRTIGIQRRLARATLDSYAAWVEQFLRFCRRDDGTWRRAEEVGGQELEAFRVISWRMGKVSCEDRGRGRRAPLAGLLRIQVAWV